MSRPSKFNFANLRRGYIFLPEGKKDRVIIEREKDIVIIQREETCTGKQPIDIQYLLVTSQMKDTLITGHC